MTAYLPLLLLLLIYLLLPVAILLLQRRVPTLARVNPIIPAYVVGLLLSVVVPHSEEIAALQDGITSGMVALAIPLMLFAVDLRGWARAGREAILSLVLATVAVVVAVTAGHLLFRAHLAESARIGGLLVGVYTGGTPNLAALRLALGVDSSLYLTVHTVDLLVSALYILVILLLGRRLVGLNGSAGDGQAFTLGSTEHSDILAVFARGARRKSALALAAAVAVVALALGTSAALPGITGTDGTAVTILLLSTFAILATLIPAVRGLESSFGMGEFFILVFSVVVGSMADIPRMLSASPMIVAYMALTVFGSLGLHLLLARLFRIRNVMVMVTSMSAVCSPPFVGMLAPIVRDPRVIAAGITTGIIGYGVGNYLGVFLAWALELL